MARRRPRMGNADGILLYIAAGLMVGILWALTGCAIGTPFNPTLVPISPGIASVVPDTLVEPDDEDYFVFMLDAVFQTVTVLTSGTTDTAGRVETADRTPITESCDQYPQPPCIFSYHADSVGDRPEAQRAGVLDSEDSPVNFVWTGMLAPGTYYVRVSAERESAGDYELSVEPSDTTPAGFVPFEPTLLVISQAAATGPDYIAEGSIDSAGEVDYHALVLNRTFNTVTVMTSGTTDTAGQVETRQRVPVAMICDGERPEATPPCVWGVEADINTPNPERSEKFNSMQASKNFIWEGKLAGKDDRRVNPHIKGTYYIGVTGENGATGPYQLTVETVNISCPPTPEDPFGYMCDD